MLAAPALSPNTVMRSGSPPNDEMCCLIQRSASSWSFRPKFPARHFKTDKTQQSAQRRRRGLCFISLALECSHLANSMKHTAMTLKMHYGVKKWDKLCEGVHRIATESNRLVPELSTSPKSSSNPFIYFLDILHTGTDTHRQTDLPTENPTKTLSAEVTRQHSKSS